MKLRRRLIPPILTLLALVAALVPAIFDMLTESQWLRWTLLAVAILFGFKSILFGWMWATLKEPGRTLTMFGAALLDFFMAVVVGDILLVIVFATTFWYVRHDIKQTPPFFIRAGERTLLLASIIWVLTTGAAVLIEMTKARGHIEVHRDMIVVAKEA